MVSKTHFHLPNLGFEIFPAVYFGTILLGPIGEPHRGQKLGLWVIFGRILFWSKIGRGGVFRHLVGSFWSLKPDFHLPNLGFEIFPVMYVDFGTILLGPIGEPHRSQKLVIFGRNCFGLSLLSG